MPAYLEHDEAIPFLFKALVAAHERRPFVGGLFNAYEVAVHYELFTGALVHGLLDVRQEEALGSGQTSCDMVLPLAGGQQLWVEVKQWWFLRAAFEGGAYINLPKTRSWPYADWMKLRDSSRSKDHNHVVLLMRTWDTQAMKAKADEWLQGLARMPGATQSGPVPLKKYRYAAPTVTAGGPSTPTSHERMGDLIAWSEFKTPSPLVGRTGRRSRAAGRR